MDLIPPDIILDHFLSIIKAINLTTLTLKVTRIAAFHKLLYYLKQTKNSLQTAELLG